MSRYFDPTNLPPPFATKPGTRLKDLTGKTFSFIKVHYRTGTEKSGKSLWLCECLACGKYKEISSDHLIRKHQTVQSCGCQQYKSGEKHHQWSGVGEISGNWWQRITRNRNRKKTVLVKITAQEAWELFLKQERKCSLSNLPLLIDNNHKINTASLDRIDSDGDYELSNVQWVHKKINWMKNTFSQEEFIYLCTIVAEHSGGYCEII